MLLNCGVGEDSCRDNLRARAFYEAKGFSLTDMAKPAFGAEEVLYAIEL